MQTELKALDAVRAAARPGIRVSELAAVFERTIRDDDWQVGPPTQHFDFHGQGQDVIELPWYAAEQPWGSAGDAPLPVGGIVSYHPAPPHRSAGRLDAGDQRQPARDRAGRRVAERRVGPSLPGGGNVTDADRFVGMQLGPISFVDEGVEPLLDSCKRALRDQRPADRDGVLARAEGRAARLLAAGGLARPRRAEAAPLRGGSFIRPPPEYYRNTFIKRVPRRGRGARRRRHPGAGPPGTHARAGCATYIDLMEPMFNYAGHGVDGVGRHPEPAAGAADRPRSAARPSRAVPQQPRLPQLAGRAHRGPLPQLRDRRDHVVQRAAEPDRRRTDRKGAALLLPALRGAGVTRGHRRRARPRRLRTRVWEVRRRCAPAGAFVDGAFIEFLRVVYCNPEALLWERFWVERNKDLDRELYGIVKCCDPELSSGSTSGTATT